jgi:hypothetical protein
MADTIPVTDQSDLLGSTTSSHAGRSVRSYVPNREFDSPDGGQPATAQSISPLDGATTRNGSGMMDHFDDLAITIIADAHGYTYAEARARIADRLRTLDQTSRALAGQPPRDQLQDDLVWDLNNAEGQWAP